MATTTTNLGLTKPALSESADVGVINENSDKIDAEAGKSRANFAATYSASSAYAVGDYCERGGNLYRCTTAIASGGEAWNSGHWTQVAVTGEIPKVIDNLTSTSATAALSAKQGKTLSDQIGSLIDAFEVKRIDSSSEKTTHTINVPNNSVHFLLIQCTSNSIHGYGIVASTSGGSINIVTMQKDGITMTTGTGTISCAIGSTARPMGIVDIKLRGAGWCTLS